MTKIPDYDTELAAVTACITALAEHGIPVDVQELLVNGSLQAGIKPHAIFNGVRAVYNTYQDCDDPSPSDGAIYSAVSRRDAMKDVLSFLESIGGAGYGGMADYEIARSIVRMEVEGPLQWALSEEAKQQIAEIDGNSRNAMINADRIVAGVFHCPVCDVIEMSGIFCPKCRKPLTMPAGTEASLGRRDPEPTPTVPASPSASASAPVRSSTGSGEQSQSAPQAAAGSGPDALSTPSGTTGS